jgi:hypothetical protein
MFTDEGDGFGDEAEVDVFGGFGPGLVNKPLGIGPAAVCVGHHGTQQRKR